MTFWTAPSGAWLRPRRPRNAGGGAKGQGAVWHWEKRIRVTTNTTLQTTSSGREPIRCILQWVEIEVALRMSHAKALLNA